MQPFYKQTTLPHLTSSRSFPIPERIGPYKIDILLNQGGMSYLYLGVDPTQKLPLAIKVLSPKYKTDPEVVRQFLNEAEIISQTNHPNIIQLYGHGKWENGLYIAMEFVQGVSLKQFILQQNLSVRSALNLILQVAYALLHLHSHGVVHRDLKPENILITNEGKIKVIDFGIAQLQNHPHKNPLSNKSQVLGTPTYMSPEQKKDPRSVTYAADIYSLGVIAFELITGKLTSGSIELMLLPQSLRKLLARTLEPTLEKRYTDIVDVITDITRYIKSSFGKPSKEYVQDLTHVWTALDHAQKKLLPREIPKWNRVKMGLARMGDGCNLGYWHDFLQLGDQSHLILFSSYQGEEFDGLTYSGMLKGMILALISPYLTSTSLLSLSQLTNQLNHFFLSQINISSFTFQMIHLKANTNQVSSISCAFPSLIHMSGESSQVRFLTNENPPLGTQPHYQFSEITENWHVGDTLISYSFPLPPDHIKTLEKIAFEYRSFSPQPQAEMILRHLSQTSSTLSPSQNGSVLTIERIG